VKGYGFSLLWLGGVRSMPHPIFSYLLSLPSGEVIATPTPQGCRVGARPPRSNVPSGSLRVLGYSCVLRQKTGMRSGHSFCHSPGSSCSATESFRA
jgi:hypothetical protein